MKLDRQQVRLTADEAERLRAFVRQTCVDDERTIADWFSSRIGWQEYGRGPRVERPDVIISMSLHSECHEAIRGRSIAWDMSRSEAARSMVLNALDHVAWNEPPLIASTFVRGIHHPRQWPFTPRMDIGLQVDALLLPGLTEWMLYDESYEVRANPFDPKALPALLSMIEHHQFEASHFDTNLVRVETRIPFGWLAKRMGSLLTGDELLTGVLGAYWHGATDWQSLKRQSTLKAWPSHRTSKRP